MADFSHSNLKKTMDAAFSQVRTLEITAEYCEQTGSIRQWRQRRLQGEPTADTGRWRCQRWQSWWQSPDFWRHQCSAFDEPETVASALVVRPHDWCTFHHLPGLSPQIIRSDDFQKIVPLLTGMAGHSAHDNALAWDWIAPERLAQYPWTFSAEAVRNSVGQPNLHGILSGAMTPPANYPQPLFCTGDRWECWIDPEAGWPWKLQGSSAEGTLWELTITHRAVDQPLDPKLFADPERL